MTSSSTTTKKGPTESTKDGKEALKTKVPQMGDYLFSNLKVSVSDMHNIVTTKNVGQSAAQRLTRQGITTTIIDLFKSGKYDSSSHGDHVNVLKTEYDEFVRDGMGDLCVDHIISNRVPIAIMHWFSFGKPAKSHPSLMLFNWETLQKDLNDLWNFQILATKTNSDKGNVEGDIVEKLKKYHYHVRKSRSGGLARVAQSPGTKFACVCVFSVSSKRVK